MSCPVTYSVSTSGGVIDGHEPESVIEAFCSAFGIKQEKATEYIDKKKLVKKDLSEAQAKVYRDKLAQIGVPVTLEKHGDEFGGMSLLPTGDEKEQSGSISSGHTGVQSVGAAAAVGTVASGASTNSQTASQSTTAGGFSCPKCQLQQKRAEQCSGCGVYIDKFLAASAARNSSSLNDSADDAAVAYVKKRVEADNKAWDGEYSYGYLPFAIAAAVVSAMVWYFIGKSFDREIGFIAIAVGGLIGYTAYWSGSRGHVNGVICACLVVLAMAGGKYMLAGHYHDYMQADFSDVFEDSGATANFDDLYNETLVEAEAYAQVDKDSPISVKLFMIEHGYTEATSVVNVGDSELDDFLEYSSYELEMMHEYAGEYTNGADMFSAVLEDTLGSYTRGDVFWSLWGLFDLAFIFFGASAAYRFGSGQKG